MDILDIPTEERNFLTLKKAIEDLKKEKEKQTKDNSELKKENEKLKKKIAILDDMEIPKEKISSTVQTNIDAKDEEMEMTGTQSLPLVEGKITPPNQSTIDKTLKVQEDDMQMTRRIVTDAVPKSSIHQPINATSFGNDDMEMTALVTLNKPEDNMEIPKEKISSTVQTNIDTKDEEMEMTGNQNNYQCDSCEKSFAHRENLVREKFINHVVIFG